MEEIDLRADLLHRDTPGKVAGGVLLCAMITESGRTVTREA
jgi:hypothetical protein